MLFLYVAFEMTIFIFKSAVGALSFFVFWSFRLFLFILACILVSWKVLSFLVFLAKVAVLGLVVGFLLLRLRLHLLDD